MKLIKQKLSAIWSKTMDGIISILSVYYFSSTIAYFLRLLFKTHTNTFASTVLGKLADIIAVMIGLALYITVSTCISKAFKKSTIYFQINDGEEIQIKFTDQDGIGVKYAWKYASPGLVSDYILTRIFKAIFVVKLEGDFLQIDDNTNFGDQQQNIENGRRLIIPIPSYYLDNKFSTNFEKDLLISPVTNVTSNVSFICYVVSNSLFMKYLHLSWLVKIEGINDLKPIKLNSEEKGGV